MYNSASVNVMILCGWKDCEAVSFIYMTAALFRSAAARMQVYMFKSHWLMWSFAARQWRSQDVFIGVASNQPGVAQKSTLFLDKNVHDYKILDYFSA